jgi:hypothetical protein
MKKICIVIIIGLLCSSALATLSSASYNTTVESGLVGYWRFDEGSGNIAADSSGNGNNGTLMNNPAWVDGKYGKALSFNGVNNNVVVPDSSSLDLSSAVTVMAWVYLPKGAHYAEGRILGKDASNGGSNLNLDIHNDAGNVSFDLGYGYGFTGPILVSSGYVPREVWTHVAATYDGSLAKIYINGVFDSSISWTAGFDTNNGMPLCIGSKNYSPGYYFFINATIDEVKLFNRVLSQQEIQNEIEGTPVSESPVIYSVSVITSKTRLQTIYINGSGFMNTQPQTQSLGDGSVDTVNSSTTPSLVINDIGKWAAGWIATGVSCGIGVIINSWSGNQIVLGGFGSALGINGQGSWNIATGDNLTVVVYTPYGYTSNSVIVVPEFPSFAILALFMMATLLAVIFYRKRTRSIEPIV